MRFRVGRHLLLLCGATALTTGTAAVAQLEKPGTAPARGPDAPDQAKDQPAASPDDATADPDAPIVPDAEFNSALPPLSSDINAPLEPMATGAPVPAASADNAAQQPIVEGALPPASPADPQLAQPLEPLSGYNTVPLQTADVAQGADAPEIAYDTEVRGLDPLELTDEFNSLSALKDGGGKAANATQVSARAKEDEALSVRLMKSIGYYDGTAASVLEPPPAGTNGKLKAIVTASPGHLYELGSITVKADPTTPPNLVDRELPLKVGDPIEAARIQGAEANVALQLPRQGYPFVKVGDRDILLDDATFKGDYTLPVDTGPRSSFGQLTTEGDAVFDLKHLNVFPRFDQGDLYDNRKTDDVREALVATGLFSSIAVEPVLTDRDGPDGTKQVDLLVRQTKGKYKTLAGSVGYGTGEGFKAEGSFTHRNLFPPEGALILTGIGGTQEQGLSAAFRRQNAGKRDRTVTLLAAANHSDYDAFSAYTFTLSGRISYDSTPIWQKPFTYYYGVELIGTAEESFDFDVGARRRKTYGVAALPGQVLWDKSDDLLNPTRGFRLRLNLSPETSIQGKVSPYVRTMVEATGYYHVSDSLVLAGRVKAGSIQGIGRDDLAPSRRYYGGGGGSVRGYGYQRLGPLEPQRYELNEDGELVGIERRPVGGRSLNEFAVEARYRFGNFGIVPFFDAGNAYESSFPQGGDLQYGAGIGGRFYTNFGPMRIDLATPLNRREGDSRIALYISIGQAF